MNCEHHIVRKEGDCYKCPDCNQIFALTPHEHFHTYPNHAGCFPDCRHLNHEPYPQGGNTKIRQCQDCGSVFFLLEGDPGMNYQGHFKIGMPDFPNTITIKTP